LAPLPFGPDSIASNAIFVNRENEALEFAQICIKNLQVRHASDVSQQKQRIIVSSQSLGKTFFGQHVIQLCNQEKIKQLLLQGYPSPDVEWFLKSKTILIDFRYAIEGQGSLCDRLKVAILRQLLHLNNQLDSEFWKKHSEYWKKQKMAKWSIQDIIAQFSRDIACPILVHFDEIDVIASYSYTDVDMSDPISAYYCFWIFVHPILAARSFVYCSGRSPALFTLGHNLFGYTGSQRRSPGLVSHFIFDGLKVDHIVTLITAKKELSIVDGLIHKLAELIYFKSLGVPRFVAYAIQYLCELHTKITTIEDILGDDFIVYLNSVAPVELDQFSSLPDNKRKKYIELIQLSLLQIPVNGGQCVPAKEWFMESALSQNVPMLEVFWRYGVYIQKSPPQTVESSEIVFDMRKNLSGKLFFHSDDFR